jgi:hypothetical protein
MTTFGTAVDSGGTVYALVWVARPEQQGGQYIVAFDQSGTYRSRIAIDLDEMTVQRFALFGSGEFLLEGARPSDGRRLAVMPAMGGALQDVFAVSDTASMGPGAPPTISDRLTRAGDGRIYFVPDGSYNVHALTPAGTSEEVFRLSDVPRQWRVFDLKASGYRLAVIYREAGERVDRARYWVAIHDTRFGERLELYGPSSRPPLCYEYAGRQDRLTVIQGGYLVTLAPF